MASNPPPFQVEDNTDDYFFDKLVDDDDDGVDLKVAATSSVLPSSAFTDENESDEVKAFANLSINDLDNSDEIKCDATSSSKHDLNLEIENDGQNGKVGTFEASEYPLVPLHTLEFDNLICEAENENGAAEVLSVLSKSGSEGLSETNMVSKSSAGSAAAGVKEVEWSAFHADSAGNDSNGFGSYSDFFSEIGGHNVGETLGNEGDGLNNGPTVAIGNEVHGSASVENSIAFKQYNEEAYNYGEVADQTTDVQDLIRGQYWEDLYPGWKYDTNTEQWYQVDGRDAGAFEQANADSNLSSNWGVSDRKPDFSYLQQTAHSVVGTLTETGSTENISNLNQASQVSEAMESTANWNQVSQVSGDTFGFTTESSQASHVNNGYPPHVVFDPQYPGWYYDTIAQEWRNLESYNASAQSTSQVQDGRYWDGYASADTFAPNNDQNAGITQSQVISQAQGFISQLQDHIPARSSSNYNLQNSSLWHPQTVSKSEAAAQFGGNQPIENHYGPNFAVSACGIQQNSVHYGGTISCYENVIQGQNDLSMPSISQGYVVGGNLSQQFNDSRFNQNDYKHSNDYHNNQNSVYFSRQQIQSAQTSYAPAAGRSSAGRPPHALVAFGFGGKLIVMKGNSSVENLNFGSQNPVGGTMSVLNLAEVANDKVDASNHGMGVCNYFQALCQQSLPGPLIGGSVGNKELNKWIDERIAQLESNGVDYTKGQVFRLLFSLLKIACQYYGKLRSPYCTDAVLKENDAPESAVAKLFASVKKDGMQFSQYDVTAHCLQQIPSEGQMRVTAIEVQNLLVSGRKREALQHAQEGQLWGPALVLAAELGDQFYVETVKKMALCQLVAGSPLRTLCLLIAGQPADVFLADGAANSNMSGAVDVPHRPSQFGANGMLDGWEDNLAVITANRTKDDELVLIHLGDCLWKDRSDIIAAHICYLVAEASFEPYSDGARLCLVGADHWKFPRTYTSPESIQKTEIYEYAKTLGNSQSVLLPFQPYKLVYAHMLAEVGRVPDALKYCQAVLKSLKTGRTLEVETLKNLASSLEERIKIYQQGGFSTNLAPKKLVGKLLNLFDSTAHRVVGGIPPQVPTEGGTIQGNEPHHQSMGPRVSTSQSTMAMSSLVPSQSMEPVSEWAADGNRRIMHARSVSEPDFSRSPIQEATSTGEQEKTSAAGGASRFGRFGFGSQLLQKTVGLVLKPRQGRQAKLGETNKFYYDEKLKRWVEEGAKPPAVEAALPPPPMTAGFQNGTSGHDLKSASQREASLNNGSPEFKSTSTVDNNSGMPPLPPTSNQYSARGRMGVRSRYVDTFNQGGGNQTNLFQSPSVPSIKPAGGANPKFFVPTPASCVEQPVDAIVNNMQDTSTTYENPSTSPLYDSFQSPASTSSMTLQRFASLNNISDQGLESGNGSFSAHSRRTASWSGSFNDPFGSSHKGEVKPMRKISSMHPSSFMPSDHPSLVQSPMNGGSIADELHEVEL